MLLKFPELKVTTCNLFQRSPQPSVLKINVFSRGISLTMLKMEKRMATLFMYCPGEVPMQLKGHSYEKIWWDYQYKP
jgi:hypothetical protein